jgi:hypothetical protein
LALVAALGLAGIGGCRHDSKDSEDYKNYLVIAGQKFRKKGAFKADMLWAGVKKRGSSNKIEEAGEVSLSIKKTEIGHPEFTIKANRTGDTLATLSDGTVFAYQYSRICWEKRNGTIKIFTLEVDNLGMDDSRPSGTSDDASKL